MTNTIKLGLLGLSAFAFTACTTTGNVEKNAAYGAAGGAVAGAVIGNNTGDGDAGEGALIGAAVGAAAGAGYGYIKDQRQGTPTTMRPNLSEQSYYDENTGRYYRYEKGTNRTFYENGQQRS